MEKAVRELVGETSRVWHHGNQEEGTLQGCSAGVWGRGGDYREAEKYPLDIATWKTRFRQWWWVKSD